MRKFGKVFLLVTLFLLIFTDAFSAPNIPPKPSEYDYVYDYAGLVNQNDANIIRSIGKAIEDASGSQLIVVTVDDIGDYPISDYALYLFRNWGIGKKDKNNGVLLLVDKKRLLEGKSGKVFISIGYGLEGAIPDSVAGRILDDYVLSKWDKKDYSGGILDGYKAIAANVAKEYNIDLNNFNTDDYVVKSRSKKDNIGNIITAIVLLIIAFSIFGNHRRGPFRRYWWWGGGPGGFGGGGFGGGFGGFGGSGGGGGSFGGGSTGGGGAGR